jgi:general secretion pathway protein B
MSYILDALKKAERERDLRQVPTIMTVHEPIAARPNRHWTIIGISALCIGIAIWLVIFSFRTKSSPAPSGSDKEYNRGSIDPDAKQATASGSAHSASLPPSPSQLPGTPKSDTAARKAGELKNAPQSEITSPVRSIPREKAAESTPRTDRRTQAGSVAERGIEEEEPVDSPPELVPIQKQLGFSSPGSAAAGGKPDAKTAQTQPALFKEALGKMKVSLLYYSDNKAERTVFINGRKYGEGDYVEGMYLLESITLEGAILSHQGERVILRPISK